MVLQNYQNFIEMTSNMNHIVAFGGGLKCPSKIHLNNQCTPAPQIFRPSNITEVDAQVHLKGANIINPW